MCKSPAATISEGSLPGLLLANPTSTGATLEKCSLNRIISSYSGQLCKNQANNVYWQTYQTQDANFRNIAEYFFNW